MLLIESEIHDAHILAECRNITTESGETLTNTTAQHRTASTTIVAERCRGVGARAAVYRNAAARRSQPMGSGALVFLLVVVSVPIGWALFSTSDCERLAVEFACVQGGVLFALALWHLAKADHSETRALSYSPAAFVSATSLAYALWLLNERIPVWDIENKTECHVAASASAACALWLGALFTSGILLTAAVSTVGVVLCSPSTTRSQ